MSRKSDQNESYDRESQNETYSSNSYSRRFKDTNGNGYGNSNRRGNKELQDRQGWSKSPRLKTSNSDSDDDESKPLGSKGYRNYGKKKIFGGLFGGSSKPKVLPPYQTVMLRVRTQCDECVRKVKRAVARINEVESITVDMNQRRLTVKGYVDPQHVLKKASNTGKTVELVNSRGSGTNFSSHEQQYGSNDILKANSDLYQPSNAKNKQVSSADKYQLSSGDRNKKSAGNGQNSKGVKFSVSPDYDRRHTEDVIEQGFASKLKKTSEYDRSGSPDAYRSNSEQRKYSNGQKIRHESDFYPRANFEKSSRNNEDVYRASLTYPASRDDGNYIFSDENANNCSIM